MEKDENLKLCGWGDQRYLEIRSNVTEMRAGYLIPIGSFETPNLEGSLKDLIRNQIGKHIKQSLPELPSFGLIRNTKQIGLLIISKQVLPLPILSQSRKCKVI